MDTAIVAIPSVDDHVWKVSSEKVPHLTMLYLGDVPEEHIAQIAKFLEHISEVSLYRFGLSVDKRGTLGDDQADVLFFEKGWSTKEVSENRGFMLQNDLIKQAYDTAPQFEGWTPHLTLGYPGSPAKEDDRDYPISYVRFDKIALWTGDFDGPEFELEDRYNDMAEVAWGDLDPDNVDDILAHYGVKGMRWGVRKDNGHEGERAKTKKIEKLDKKFEKNSQSYKTTIAIHNRAADLANKNDVDRINNKPEYKDADFTRNTPLRQQYYAEQKKAYIDRLVQAADEMGTNASGTRKYRIIEGADGSWDVFTDEVKHADEPEMRVLPQYEEGRITSLKVAEPIAHGEESNYELKHYGVKGMRWGVRKSEHEGGTRAKRAPVPVSADKQKANEAAARVSKKGDTSALSNQELQQLVQRMNLEQQYSRLSSQPGRLEAGNKKAKQLLDTVDTGTKLAKLAGKTPAGQKVGNFLKKNLRKAALATAVGAGKLYYKSRKG